MDNNLKIYNALATPPADALRQIRGGRMNGKTDISPQWRIEAMTAQFGPIGCGWYYETTRQWSEPGADGAIMCFVNIALYVKCEGEWSKPIHGTGGSMLIEKERSGLHTSDEGYKMATTDALSVAMKQLGVAADIYRGVYDSKYSKQQGEASKLADELATAKAKAAADREKLLKLFADVSQMLEKVEKAEGIAAAAALAEFLPTLATAPKLQKFYNQ